MPTELPEQAKEALDSIIKKARVHFYKPIQIAEILFHHRTELNWDLSDLESYRNISKRWRDKISVLLVGRRSTSSQKYQDNIFDSNAMPPELLVQLGQLNRENGGFIEAYIYEELRKKLSLVHMVDEYIKSSTADDFSLEGLIDLFTSSPGLIRSIDKIYEILVYALFTTIVPVLKVQTVVSIQNEDEQVIDDFKQFIANVLGAENGRTECNFPAGLYRTGITNAADTGIDIWTNFGSAIQVKHSTLTMEDVMDIADSISADKVIIVCVDVESNVMNLLHQSNLNNRVQSIVTFTDLENWYQLCLSDKYRDTLGHLLLENINKEFVIEFPSIREIKPFIEGRGYDTVAMPSNWLIQS